MTSLSLSYLLLHRVDSDVEGRVVPLHLLLLLHMHHLGAAVSSTDSNHPQDDHEEQETHAYHNNGCHTKVCTQTHTIVVLVSQLESYKYINSRN